MNMKLARAVLVIFLACNSGNLYAQSASETLQAYVEGGDNQDAITLENILHKDFVSNYTFIGENVVKLLPRKTFIKMFREKKFGGDSRKYIQHSSIASENLVLINAELIGSGLTFRGVFVMQRESGKWQLKEEYLIVKPS